MIRSPIPYPSITHAAYLPRLCRLYCKCFIVFAQSKQSNHNLSIFLLIEIIVKAVSFLEAPKMRAVPGCALLAVPRNVFF